MATITALLFACATSLFEPLPSPKLSFTLGEDGRAWVISQSQITLGAQPVAFSWPLTESYIDRGSARILSIDPAGAATVVDRRESSAGVQWSLLSTNGSPREVTVRVGAVVPDLHVAWIQHVLASPGKVEWDILAKVSGWKGPHLDGVTIATPFGAIQGLNLRSDVAPSILVSSRPDIPCRLAIRWDSGDNSDTPARIVCLDRDLASPFGLRRLPAGKLTVRLGGMDFTQDFKGAAPGQLIELRAGDATGVLVKRTTASSTQVNVHSDANRRLAMYDEQLQYNYALTNATDAAIDLQVYEHPAHGWKVQKCSGKWTKLDAGTMVMTVKLAPRSEGTLAATLLRKNLTPS